MLVFCSTRKDCAQVAKAIADAHDKSGARLWEGGTQDARLKDKMLASLVPRGVAVHHAGLDMVDRDMVEALFREGHIAVVCATSTLAVGVNLPAHLVIIKNTMTYSGASLLEYSQLDVLQMIGRAGRPQYDRSGVAVILTEKSKVRQYETLVNGSDPLESHLHSALDEHVNAEIALGTIKSQEMAKTWLRGTFLSVRMQQNPARYGEVGRTETSEVLLNKLCGQSIRTLIDDGLVQQNDARLEASPYGTIMARYYVRHSTMREIMKLRKKSTVRQIVGLTASIDRRPQADQSQFIALCKADEFSNMKLRAGDKPLFNELKKHVAMRYSYEEKVRLIAADVHMTDSTSID